MLITVFVVLSIMSIAFCAYAAIGGAATPLVIISGCVGLILLAWVIYCSINVIRGKDREWIIGKNHEKGKK